MIPMDLLTLAPTPSACCLAVTILAIDLADIVFVFVVVVVVVVVVVIAIVLRLAIKIIKRKVSND